MSDMNYDKFKDARENAKGWLASIEEMLSEYELAGQQDAETSKSYRVRENAERTIHESVLSVMVRDDWREPGRQTDESPDEYEILLTTGGPALRIWGKLRDGNPHTAELQMQDWGTPWTRYPAPEATLINFASCFYFGD
jgi:hypothetical protein